MIKAPDVQPSSAWTLAWQGYFLDQRAHGRSPKTIRNRQSSVMLLARWATAQCIEPEDLTKTHMKQYMVAQLEGRQGSGAQTMYQDIKSFFAWFAAEYEVPSAMTGIPRPKGRSKMVNVLTPEQFKAVLDAAKSQEPWLAARDVALLWLLLESGLRRAEIVALDVEDVNLVARTVVVKCGKGGKSRVGVFGDEAATALHRWLRKSKNTGPLFTSKAGHRLSLPGIRAILLRVGDERAGIHVHCHQFRHSFAHYALASGARESDLMEVAGWSTRAMLDRYGASLRRERALAAMADHQVGNMLKGR